MNEIIKPLRIVAITKTFRGECFAEASLASISAHVTRIVYVHSDIAWNGETGNTVREIAKSIMDPENKIVHIDAEGTQNDQYNAAIKWLIENEIKYEYVMLIDTDEVWSDEGWKKANSILQTNLEDNSPAMSIRCRLFDYIKSPFYRIDPPAPLEPVVFVHKKAVALNAIDIRGCNIGPTKVMRDVYFHHFCSVRKSLTDVWNKHKTSCGTEEEPIVDREMWINTVWNQLPNAENCLPLAKYRHNWKGVKGINKYDLPAAILDHPLVLAWERYPTFTCNKTAVDIKPLLKKVGLSIDYGPGHPDWNIPSKRRRYDIALAMAAQNG